MSDIEKGARLEESRHSFRKDSLATLSATAVNEPCSPPPSISSVETVFPEAQSWSTPRDDGLLATLLRLDRRSLFTGSTADLEVAYFIPPDPTDASEAVHVVSLKAVPAISADGLGISADGLRLLRKRCAIASKLGVLTEHLFVYMAS